MATGMMQHQAGLSWGFISKIALVVPLLGLLSCSNSEPPNGTPASAEALHRFEKEFSESLSYRTSDTAKLIGFKKVQLTSAGVGEFTSVYAANQDKMKNYFFDPGNAIVRIYFPVEGALVEQGGGIVEASALGELAQPSATAADAEMFVVGRRQTDQIKGVEGNLIKDGIIYLAEKNKTDHRLGNVYVFDFGYKHIVPHSGYDHHGDDIDTVYGKKSCMSNHGRLNCSDAFHIYKGRCAFNSRVCMDYNGWFTNCENGKWLNFPGSDCDYALGAGHCWNEIM